MPGLTQKDLQAQTELITKLIKSEAVNTETKLTKLIKSEISVIESRLDEKFETNRRLMVNDMQNFQDAIITEIKSIKLETSVNSSHRRTLDDHETRISKVEKHLFSN